jgi:hypothetical protein
VMINPAYELRVPYTSAKPSKPSKPSKDRDGKPSG